MKNIVAALLFFVFHTAQAFTPTNTQEITKDQQTAGLDATVTVDHRLLSEGGRNAIKEDFEDTNNHFNHEVLQGTVEGIQAGSVGAVVDAVGRKIDLRHGIVAIQTDENSLTEQQLNAVNGKHSDADSKQQGMQSLSDRLTDQAGVAGQEILLYMNSGDIAGGFHHDQSNSSSVNAAITNMTDGGEIVKVVAHETTHHILNEQNNNYTGNQKETAATKDGDYAQRLWEQQNARNGHTTGGSAEDVANWNTNNKNSDLIKTNTDRVAAVPASEREEIIPVLIVGGIKLAEFAFTAYEAKQLKDAYDRGEVTKEELAKMAAINAATSAAGLIPIPGGSVASKVLAKGAERFKKHSDASPADIQAATKAFGEKVAKKDGTANSVTGKGNDIKESRSSSLISQNKAKGDAFEEQVKSQLEKTDTNVVQQVTVKTQSGVKTRIDILSKDYDGIIKCTECKASATAPLTKNQKAAFPEIEKTGGIVVGKGKPGFPGGTEIPPTKVDIVRP